MTSLRPAMAPATGDVPQNGPVVDAGTRQRTDSVDVFEHLVMSEFFAQGDAENPLTKKDVSGTPNQKSADAGSENQPLAADSKSPAVRGYALRLAGASDTVVAAPEEPSMDGGAGRKEQSARTFQRPSYAEKQDGHAASTPSPGPSVPSSLSIHIALPLPIPSAPGTVKLSKPVILGGAATLRPIDLNGQESNSALSVTMAETKTALEAAPSQPAGAETAPGKQAGSDSPGGTAHVTAPMLPLHDVSRVTSDQAATTMAGADLSTAKDPQVRLHTASAAESAEVASSGMLHATPVHPSTMPAGGIAAGSSASSIHRLTPDPATRAAAQRPDPHLAMDSAFKLDEATRSAVWQLTPARIEAGYSTESRAWVSIAAERQGAQLSVAIATSSTAEHRALASMLPEIRTHVGEQKAQFIQVDLRSSLSNPQQDGRHGEQAPTEGPDELPPIQRSKSGVVSASLGALELFGDRAISVQA